MLTMLLDVAQAAPVAPEGFWAFMTRAGLTPESLLLAFSNTSENFGNQLISATPLLLATCVAIRMLAGLFKEMIDGDLVGAIGVVLSSGLMGFILGALLAWWSGGPLSIREIALDSYEFMMNLASGGGDSAFNTLMGNMVNGAWHSIQSILLLLNQAIRSVVDGIFAPLGAVTGLFSGVSAIFNVLAAVPSFLAILLAGLCAVLAVISVLLLTIAVMFFAFGGVIMLHAGLAFGPLALAVYPLVDSWARNVLGVMVGGIVQVTAGLLIVSIAGTVAHSATEAIASITIT